MGGRRRMERTGGLILFLAGWVAWALAVNALVQRFYPTRSNDDPTRHFLYSLIVKVTMVAPLIGLALYMNSGQP